jgi:hypothetical protein
LEIMVLVLKKGNRGACTEKLRIIYAFYEWMSIEFGWKFRAVVCIYDPMRPSFVLFGYHTFESFFSFEQIYRQFIWISGAEPIPTISCIKEF